MNPFSGESEIFIKDGGYYFGSGFAGFTLSEGTHIRMGHAAHLMVPTFYSGYVFNFLGKVEHITVRGGVIAESGDTADLNNSGRNWTAFRFRGSGATRGIYFNKIEDVTIWNPRYGFHVDLSVQGWFNSNTIKDCTVYYPEVGLKFTAASGALGSQGANSNDFINLIVQAISGATRRGVDAESGRGTRNTFIDCAMWDLGPSSGTTAAYFGTEFASSVIINGIMTYPEIVTLGSGTRIFDAFTTPSFDGLSATTTYTPQISFSGGGGRLALYNTASGGASTVDMYGPSGSNNPSISFWDQDAKNDRLLIQKTTINNFRSTRSSTSGTVYPTVFQMDDPTVPTRIEGLRVTESGNVEMNRSGGTVQFKSGNTSLTRTVTAAMSGAFGPLGFITARLGTLDIKVPYFAA